MVCETCFGREASVREGPVPSDGELKRDLYAWTVRPGLVVFRKFGGCVRNTGPCTRNPACCAGSVIDGKQTDIIKVLKRGM